MAWKRKKGKKDNKSSTGKATFAQITKNNVENLLKLREAFPVLPAKKIIELNFQGNNTKEKKTKTRITTKGPSRKNVLIPMDNNDKGNILNHANIHVGQINSLLKSYKSSTSINCIRES